MGPADAALQHSAAPHRNPVALRQGRDVPRRRESPDPARLDVDDPARPHLDRPAGVGDGMHRFVQADGSRDLPLERGVVPHVVVFEGLFDHHQPELVEFLEERFIRQRVGAVRVHHERHVRIALAHFADHVDVPPGLDLDLDPPVAPGEFEPDLVQELVHGVLDSDGDPGNGARARPAENAGERFVLETREGVPHRHLDSGLGHVVAADAGEGRNDFIRMGVVVPGRQRPQEIADEVFGGADRLGGVARSDIGDALGMPAHAIDLGFEEEELLLGHPREAGFEGVLEVEPEFPDRESVDLHAAAPNVKGRQGRPERSLAALQSWRRRRSRLPRVITKR